MGAGSGIENWDGERRLVLDNLGRGSKQKGVLCWTYLSFFFLFVIAIKDKRHRLGFFAKFAKLLETLVNWGRGSGIENWDGEGRFGLYIWGRVSKQKGVLCWTYLIFLFVITIKDKRHRLEFFANFAKLLENLENCGRGSGIENWDGEGRLRLDNWGRGVLNIKVCSVERIRNLFVCYNYKSTKDIAESFLQVI